MGKRSEFGDERGWRREKEGDWESEREREWEKGRERRWDTTTALTKTTANTNLNTNTNINTTTNKTINVYIGFRKDGLFPQGDKKDLKMRFAIKKTIFLSDLFFFWSEKMGYRSSDFKYLFCGDELSGIETPTQLKMKDGDFIDAGLHHCGY